MTSISVIIPTYKHASFLPGTLASVFGQARQPDEVIVINDGSPDDTEAVLAPFIRRKSIVYRRQENAGQAAARNAGIELASSEYVALLDDDDLWPPEKLQRHEAILRAAPGAVAVYGDVHPFTSAEELPRGLSAEGLPLRHPRAPSGEVTRDFLARNWIVSPGQTMIRRSILAELRGFDTEIWGADDYDLYIRLSRLGQIVFDPHVSLFYRRHSGNASRNVELMFQNCMAVHKKHWGGPKSCLRHLPLWMHSQLHLRRYFFEKFCQSASESLHDSQLDSARRIALMRAASIFPFGILRRSFWRLFLSRS